jgi:hypothetical protein
MNHRTRHAGARRDESDNGDNSRDDGDDAVWFPQLFAYACDTLSRPEGINDHTVDDCPRDLERWALTKPAETMSRLNAPRPEQSPARPDGRILRRPPAH